MTIEDNFYNISLFKVIGYNNKEIDKMVLGGYMIYGILTFVITIPIGMAVLTFVTYAMAQYYEVLFPVKFKLWHGEIIISIFILLFNLGAFVAK